MPDIDKVKSLHTALIDTIDGYEKAEREAESPELQRLFAAMVALRRQHHAELHRALVEHGESPGDDGSFMATVHRTVIGVRAAMKGIGRDALSAFISGERHNLEAYDAAIAAYPNDPDLPELLRAQKSALQARVVEMERLAQAD